MRKHLDLARAAVEAARAAGAEFADASVGACTVAPISSWNVCGRG